MISLCFFFNNVGSDLELLRENSQEIKLAFVMICFTSKTILRRYINEYFAWRNKKKLNKKNIYIYS